MKIGKLNRQNFGNQRHRSITSKYQVYLSFGRSTRTILRKGCAGNKMKSDSTKGLCSARQNHNFTPVLDDRQKFCTGNKNIQILRNGCARPPKITILPQFQTIDTQDLCAGSKTAISPQFRGIDTRNFTKRLHFRKQFSEQGAHQDTANTLHSFNTLQDFQM